MSLTGAQIRAGRALLRWSAEQLAEHAKVARITITKAEAVDGEPPIRAGTADLIQHALEAGGVEFIPENGGGAGVRLRAKGS